MPTVPTDAHKNTPSPNLNDPQALKKHVLKRPRRAGRTTQFSIHDMTSIHTEIAPHLEWPPIPLSEAPQERLPRQPLWHDQAVRFYVAAKKNSITAQWEQSDVEECFQVAILTDIYNKNLLEVKAASWQQLRAMKDSLKLHLGAKLAAKVTAVKEEDEEDYNAVGNNAYAGIDD